MLSILLQFWDQFCSSTHPRSWLSLTLCSQSAVWWWSIPPSLAAVNSMFCSFLLSRKVISHPAAFVGNLGTSMPRCFCPQSVNSKAWSKEGGLAFAPWKSQNPGLFPMQTFMIEKERSPSLLVCLFPTCQTLLPTLDYVTAAGHCFWFRL